jgi:hypothetical protein
LPDLVSRRRLRPAAPAIPPGGGPAPATGMAKRAERALRQADRRPAEADRRPASSNQNTAIQIGLADYGSPAQRSAQPGILRRPRRHDRNRFGLPGRRSLLPKASQKFPSPARRPSPSRLRLRGIQHAVGCAAARIGTGALAGCPIFARFVRKGGIPPLLHTWNSWERLDARPANFSRGLMLLHQSLRNSRLVGRASLGGHFFLLSIPLRPFRLMLIALPCIHQSHTNQDDHHRNHRVHSNRFTSQHPSQ